MSHGKTQADRLRHYIIILPCYNRGKYRMLKVIDRDDGYVYNHGRGTRRYFFHIRLHIFRQSIMS